MEFGGYPVRPTDPVKSGYIFKGWVTTDGGSTAYDFGAAVTESTGDAYASWEAVAATYTVTFIANGAELKREEVVTGGTVASAPFFTVPSGYDFDGKWYYDDDGDSSTPDVEFVFGTTTVPLAQAFSGSAALSAALLLLCGIWTLTIGAATAKS